jgi:hypothetical protein
MLARPELLEPIRSYDDLHKALRARADELNLSRLELDRLAGITSGYASKLLAPVPLKRLSPYTFTLMVGALGIRLRVEEDPEALERISRFAQKREVKVPMRAHKINPRSSKHFSLRQLKKWASRGGDMRAYRLGKRRRRAIAKQAAAIRWRDVKNAMAERNGKPNGKG